MEENLCFIVLPNYLSILYLTSGHPLDSAVIYIVTCQLAELIIFCYVITNTCRSCKERPNPPYPHAHRTLSTIGTLLIKFCVRRSQSVTCACCSIMVNWSGSQPNVLYHWIRSISTPPWLQYQFIVRLLPPSSINCHNQYTFYLHSWVERDTLREKCLAQEHNSCCML